MSRRIYTGAAIADVAQHSDRPQSLVSSPEQTDGLNRVGARAGEAGPRVAVSDSLSDWVPVSQQLNPSRSSFILPSNDSQQRTAYVTFEPFIGQTIPGPHSSNGT